MSSGEDKLQYPLTCGKNVVSTCFFGVRSEHKFDFILVQKDYLELSFSEIKEQVWLIVSKVLFQTA